MRAGQYKSDLCKVMSVDYSKGVAEVKLVPRIDYAEMAKRQQEGGRALPFGGHKAGKARVKARSALLVVSNFCIFCHIAAFASMHC